jgi:hypothetical protein
MAFNFYGTFTIGQLNELRTFSRYQSQDLQKRIDWLKSQLERIGTLKSTLDQGTPQTYQTSTSTYLGKLFLAYKMMGGNPERDFIIRQRDQTVFKTRGSPLNDDPYDKTDGSSDEYTNGVSERGIRNDSASGLFVDRAKAWQLEVIKRKREYLEYKIKKIIDYSDELAKELASLEFLIDESTDILETDGLIDEVIAQANIPGATGYVPDDEDLFGEVIRDPVDPLVEQDFDQGAATGRRIPV